MPSTVGCSRCTPVHDSLDAAEKERELDVSIDPVAGSSRRRFVRPQPGMSIRLVPIALLAACATSPHPIANTSREPTRYPLQPIRLRGGEGLHSAWHSSTLVTGTLELVAERVALHLALATDESPVHCPPNLQGTSLQACAPSDARSTRSTTSLELEGDARWSGDTLTAHLHRDTLRAELRCTESVLGLSCALEPGNGLLGRGPGDHPDRFVFATAPQQRFELDATKLSTGEQVDATLVLDATSEARLEVRVDGRPVEALAGSFNWTAGGFVVQAQTSPTRTWSMYCKETPGARPALACEVTADRSVFGTADHLVGPTVFARS